MMSKDYSKLSYKIAYLKHDTETGVSSNFKMI